MNNFEVVVNTMVEAGRERYFVTLYHPERPERSLPWDEGRIDIYDTLIKENAELEKARWEDFFNYPEPPKRFDNF